MDDRLASIDLGSNTFRLSIARIVRHGDTVQLYDEDRMRELVAMASGLDEHQRVNAATIAQVLAALRRFGERLRGFSPGNVRAVATNTFRVARNAADILPQAEKALGFPIEIISGQEEARLIYLGVIQSLPPSDHRRLVIDIGGGSTEFIIGQGGEPLHLASLGLGCTSWTRRFFPDGRITAVRLQQATLAAREAIETITQRYRRTGWDEAYGSSGTAKGLLAVLVENSLSEHDITPAGLERLGAALAQAGEVRLADWAGLKEERASVLAGGLAILTAAFQELGITHMGAGDGALRIGVLHDLLGRDFHHDQRDESVRQMAERYRIDTTQAGHVRELALDLFDQLGLAPGTGTQELRQALRWAATLHEVGLAIAHSDYHKHGAYILEHADLPGFSRDDQQRMGFLVRGHQGRLGKVRRYAPDRDHWLALCCLRLAVLLMRGREPEATQPIHLQVQGPTIRLCLTSAWLQAHPLSEYSLRTEAEVWPKAGFTMEIAKH